MRFLTKNEIEHFGMQNNISTNYTNWDTYKCNQFEVFLSDHDKYYDSLRLSTSSIHIDLFSDDVLLSVYVSKPVLDTLSELHKGDIMHLKYLIYNSNSDDLEVFEVMNKNVLLYNISFTSSSSDSPMTASLKFKPI